MNFYKNIYGGITFPSKKALYEFIEKQIQPKYDEAVRKYNETLNEAISKGIKEARVSEMDRAVKLLLPVMTTSLYETLNLSEKKQKQVIQRLHEIMKECTEENIFEWDEYKEFCKKNERKYFEVEVENE